MNLEIKLIIILAGFFSIGLIAYISIRWEIKCLWAKYLDSKKHLESYVNRHDKKITLLEDYLNVYQKQNFWEGYIKREEKNK